jgi:hypothetical protein
MPAREIPDVIQRFVSLEGVVHPLLFVEITNCFGHVNTLSSSEIS